MKTTTPQPTPIRQIGFTLIEMIGVLAIMSILAAIITPNALRMLDRASVRAEVNTVNTLGEQVKLFLKTKGWAPGLKPTAPVPSWDQDLATFADISSVDILTNKRQMVRSYIYEPIASPRRVLIISSMRAGLALPSAANLNSMALFDNVWNAADGVVPPTGTSWAGWAAWRASLNGTAGDYLIIERVNLAPTTNTDLQTEVDTVHLLGEQVKLFLKANGWPPGLKPTAPVPSWNQDLATYADISSADILTNKRQMARSYIYEPIASPRRVLILSRMSTVTGLALPTAANLNTMALFDNVWNTADGAVPPTGTSWAGWAAWRATVGDYPVIERVNLAPIYNTDLQTLNITLNNRSAATVSYNIVGQGWFNILPPTAPATNTSKTITCRPKDMINLYRSAGGLNLDYSYVVTTTSSGRTFDFNTGTNWVPQP
jgi:prepilin-type N-terminal cleavage/methylation domain-containing protein